MRIYMTLGQCKYILLLPPSFLESNNTGAGYGCKLIQLSSDHVREAAFIKNCFPISLCLPLQVVHYISRLYRFLLAIERIDSKLHGITARLHLFKVKKAKRTHQRSIALPAYLDLPDASTHRTYHLSNKSDVYVWSG
jgi:hypothetical protein